MVNFHVDPACLVIDSIILSIPHRLGDCYTYYQKSVTSNPNSL